MTIKRPTTPLQRSLLALVTLVGAASPQARAQGEQTTMATSPHHAQALDSKTDASAFLSLVRDSTERFRDVAAAEAEGYRLLFGCVSGPDWGAMGMHFVNMSLVGDGVLDPAKPEIVIYEPLPNGKLRLIGADYLVLAADWHAKNPAAGPPELMGQLLHLFESPNRFGLPDFYTLHVWAWKENPNGAFVNWHPKVSCEAFNGPQS